MIRGVKKVKIHIRSEIESIKANIRESSRPFDGSGQSFSTALKELREEGWVIQYRHGTCHYLCLGNPSKNIPPNLSPVWEREISYEH